MQITSLVPIFSEHPSATARVIVPMEYTPSSSVYAAPKWPNEACVCFCKQFYESTTFYISMFYYMG